jgi:hypothetical protein
MGFKLDMIDREYETRSREIDAAIQAGADAETILYLYFEQVATIARGRLRFSHESRQRLMDLGNKMVTLVAQDITGGYLPKVVTLAKLAFYAAGAGSKMYAGYLPKQDVQRFAWYGYGRSYNGAGLLTEAFEGWQRSSLDGKRTVHSYGLDLVKAQQQESSQDFNKTQEEMRRLIDHASQVDASRRKAIDTISAA